LARNLVVIISLTLFLGVFVLGFSFQESFAYEVTYDPTGFTLKDNPTICVVNPSSYDLSEKEIEKLLKQTKLSSDEWEAKFKQNQRNSEVWEINYVVISESDDDSDCDISIVFKPKPGDERYEHLLAGLADYDPIDDNYLITIYYLQTKLQYESERIGDTIYYWYEPWFGDDLKISQDLGNTIRHEIGHSFGLGHYKPDNPDVPLEWAKGFSPSPSIMVEVMFESPQELKIQDGDISKIREIYGSDGFQTFINDQSFDSFRAEAFLEKDYHDELIKYSEKYLGVEPNNEDALTFKALALWELDYYDESVIIMDNILDTNPENQNALYIKAKSFYKSKNYDESLNLMDKLIEINPEHYKALSYKGLILDKMERYDEAIESFKKSFEINQFYKTNLNRWANLLSDFEYYEESLELYNRAIEIDPKYVSALYNKANTLLDMEYYEEALEYYDKVLEIDPNHVKALKNKAITLEALGNLEDAQIYYEKSEKAKSKESDTQVTTPNDKKEPVERIGEHKLVGNTIKSEIPDWIRNNASWWVQGNIDDKAFVGGIQFLIKEGIIQIPETTTSITNGTQDIPVWIKNNADWWAQELISDGDFLKGIQFMVENGIITV